MFMVMTARTSNNAKFNTRLIKIWHLQTHWKEPLFGCSPETSVNSLQIVWCCWLWSPPCNFAMFNIILTTVWIKHNVKQQRCDSEAEVVVTLPFVSLTGPGTGPSGTPAWHKPCAGSGFGGVSFLPGVKGVFGGRRRWENFRVECKCN